MASTLSFRKTTPPPAVQTPAPAPAAVSTPPPTPPTPPTPPAKPVEQTLAAAQEPPRPVAPTQPAQPVAQEPSPGTEVVPEDFYSGVGGFIGEWSAKDMATPYLTIVGKTSKAFDVHSDWLGQWLYDKEYPLGTTLRVVFLSATKWFVEDLPFGTQQVAQRFARMADARAAGFNESNLKDTAELDLLIEVDADIEGVGDLAHIIEGDKGYILARYSVQSTAFGKTASILAKDMGGFLRGCMFSGFYTMETQVKTGQKGTYYIPILRTDGKTPDGLKRQIVERLSLASKKAA